MQKCQNNMLKKYENIKVIYNIWFFFIKVRKVMEYMSE